jgi:hypothetical protein
MVMKSNVIGKPLPQKTPRDENIRKYAESLLHLIRDFANAEARMREEYFSLVSRN